MRSPFHFMYAVGAWLMARFARLGTFALYVYEHCNILRTIETFFMRTASSLASVRYIPFSFNSKRYDTVTRRELSSTMFEYDRALLMLDFLSMAYQKLLLGNHRQIDHLMIYKVIGTHIVVLIPRSHQETMFKKYYIVCRGDLSVYDCFHHYQSDQVAFGSISKSDSKSSPMVCKGFEELWKQHKPAFMEWLTHDHPHNFHDIHIAGHGVGCYLSSMIALHIQHMLQQQGLDIKKTRQKLILYNFSEPRMGNHDFYDLLEPLNRWTINNVHDPFTLYPSCQTMEGTMNFYYARPVSRRVELDVQCSHINENYVLSAYIAGLEGSFSPSGLIWKRPPQVCTGIIQP